jgi:uncharacterized protein YchJ
MARDCPCHSGRRYRECCEPLHQGRDAETPEALMRSRYAAFALGLGDYIAKTGLESAPPKTPGRRYLGLRIHDAHGDTVLFFARIFERGVDCSFGELSTFEKNGAWRYTSGVIIPKERMALVAGARRFDRGEFFDAHEAWEEQWRVEKDPAMRVFLQGLIQVAAGFHKLVVMASPESAARLFERGLEKLDEAPAEYGGIDVASFRDAVRAFGREAGDRSLPRILQSPYVA